MSEVPHLPSCKLSAIQAIELDLYQDIEKAARDHADRYDDDYRSDSYIRQLKTALAEMDRFRKDYP